MEKTSDHCVEQLMKGLLPNEHEALKQEHPELFQSARDRKRIQIAERRDLVRELAQRGLTRTEIAAELGVGVETVDKDRKALNLSRTR